MGTGLECKCGVCVVCPTLETTLHIGQLHKELHPSHELAFQASPISGE